MVLSLWLFSRRYTKRKTKPLRLLYTSDVYQYYEQTFSHTKTTNRVTRLDRSGDYSSTPRRSTAKPVSQEGQAQAHIRTGGTWVEMLHCCAQVKPQHGKRLPYSKSVSTNGVAIV